MPRILLSEYHAPDTSGGLPELLKRAGCEVHVHAARSSWLLKTRYFDRWHEADTGSPRAYARSLEACVSQSEYDWIILAEDSALRAAREFIADEAMARRILPLASLEHRELIGSKTMLSILCGRYHIPTPEFAVVADGNEAARLDAAAQAVGYPLILKVDQSGGGGQGVFKCEDAASLSGRVAALGPASRRNLLLQAYVEGEDVAVEALFSKGSLAACASSTVMQTVGGAFGVSSVRRYAPDAAAERALAQAGTALGLHGFCNATFRREAATGNLLLIEADQRPNIWFPLARHAGVDFSEAAGALVSGEPLGRARAQGSLEIRHFHRDINRSLESGDWRNLLRWASNAGGRWRFIPWHDPRLLAACADAIARRQLEALAMRYPAVRAVKNRLRAFAILGA